jgi:aminodeoxychorismate synthase component I
VNARRWFHLAERLDAPVSASVFRTAFPARRASTFLLDGGGSATLDRQAFMGAEPIASFRVTRTRSGGEIARDALGRATASIVVEEAGTRRTLGGADPFDALRTFIAAHAPPPDVFDARYPFPLRAGLVGYFGYEVGQLLERLPCIVRPSVGMPDIVLAMHRWVVATSRDRDESWLSVVGSGPTPAAARADAEATRDRVVSALSRAQKEARDTAPISSRRRVAEPPRIEAALSHDEYLKRVAAAKAHIAAGDAFEICLTNALRAPLADDDAPALWELLRRSNPAPFAALLDLPEGVVVSSSPERFLSLDARRIAESRPIKGTRPRGASAEEDARLARELRESEKDRAENAMIVDLVRNDLGRVCRFGTVVAPELFAVESYATVHQLVSTIRGELEPGRDAVDLLCACFPPGSMTGAPKIEAMRILERLEPVERGVYSGAIGWMDLGGAMDLSVVIRTAVVRDGVATFSVGGAIVADSDPSAEHEETEHKARALVAALGAIGSRRHGAAHREEVEQA